MGRIIGEGITFDDVLLIERCLSIISDTNLHHLFLFKHMIRKISFRKFYLLQYFS